MRQPWNFLNIRGRKFSHQFNEDVNSVQYHSWKITFQWRGLTSGKKSGNHSGKYKQEKLWLDLLANSSNWWDNRVGKPHARFPDFKHKQTGEVLWLDSGRNPAWVASEVASITPGVSILAATQSLSKYNKAGQFLKTLQHFQKIQKEGVTGDPYIFVHVLNACAALKNLKQGRLVHKQIVETGFQFDVYLCSSLVDMYAKCGSLQDAQGVFDKMPTRNVVSWTAMIQGQVKCGKGFKALQLFEQMQREGIRPDRVCFVALLNACANMAALDEGRRVHKQIIKSGCESDIAVCNSLVSMYAKCGSLPEAQGIFNKMPTRDVVSWTAMISGHVNCGKGLKALDLYQQMQIEKVEPNSITFVALVKACASIAGLEEGRRIHEQIAKAGRELDGFVSNSLVDMYCKCGSLRDAEEIFKKIPNRDVVSWTAMILGHVNCGEGSRALGLYQQMQQEGVKPNYITFVALLKACTSMVALEEGRRVHKLILESGFELDVMVCNSIVDMYAKCASLQEALSTFNTMQSRDVVSWTAIILGHVNCGECVKALDLYQQMQLEGVEPDCITFVSVLNACASIAALEEGRRVHKQIVETGCKLDVNLSNSLLDMYAKCGSLGDAKAIFNNMPARDVVSWTSMIMGYAMNGLAEEAVTLFEQMSLSGSEINEVTFVCLLSACSHGGLVTEGVKYFESMRSVYGICPAQEHYTCMVDILGRAGRLDDAEAIVKRMPLEPSAAVWMSLLGACRIHGNVEMGERVSKRMLELDCTSAAGYVLLSNIYAAAGQYKSKSMFQEKRSRKCVMKQPGRTWIEVNNEVHSFVVNDQQHPKISLIHTELRKLSEHMNDAGYVPDVRFSLHDAEEEKQVQHLSRHSEKLAIAFGIISTPSGAPLRIVKNLRVCGDCHTATKFISEIVGREITVRDANRFHHIKNGHCSCLDYW